MYPGTGTKPLSAFWAWCRALMLCAALAAARSAAAGDSQFDLVGPSLSGTVTRGATTLSLTQVPSFQVGDKLLLRPELPKNQSAQYLMVAVFLRGSTNPPPDNWFFSCKTWSHECTSKGLALTVPPAAQQVLIFFAPRTGGDFKTLRSAVQGKPGAFVRAALQLNQAALDRSRIDLYIAGVRQLELADPAGLKDSAPLLARSLAIKVDEKCLDRIPSLQVACLTQGHDSLILNDGHEATVASTLTSGPASDLAFQAASTPKLDSGALLPYLGSLFDIARLMDNFHTAQYQYIPALTARQGDELLLMLNTPPSFHEPQSVLVATLPAVESASPPTLLTVDSGRTYCAYQSPLVLAVEGAPLVFSTGYARDLKLTVPLADGKAVTLPARPDAQKGGFVVDTSTLTGADIDEQHGATLSGNWGFDAFAGPSFRLVKPQGHPWAVAAGEDSLLIADQENTLHLHGGSAGCIDDIRVAKPGERRDSVAWKADKGDAIELKVPLKGVEPGPVSLEIRQFGMPEPQTLALTAFDDAGHLTSFTLYAGDVTGTLKGTHLDQVESLQLKSVGFTPGVPDTDDEGADFVTMTANDAQGANTLKAGESLEARVLLKDGRHTTLKVAVGAPRPRGVLIAKDVQRAPGGATPIELTDSDELPLDATLAFSIRTLAPQVITRDEQIEVETVDGANSILMSVGNGRLTLESRSVAVAKLQPATDFGASAFGALQFRLIFKGVAGDWQHLATLTRLPVLNSLQCASATDTTCVLGGSDLYLLESVANNRKFSSATRVAEGFPGSTLQVPNPTDGKLYLKLRDNPGVINAVTFAAPPPPVLPAPTPQASPPPALPPQAPSLPTTAQPTPAALH